MNCPQLESSLERLFTTVSQPTAEILDRALSGHDITVDEAARLFDADGSDLFAIIAAADALRARTVGDVVTYVINRNINFTNVCIKACGFCAFSRGHLAEEGYFLPVDEVIRRAKEAQELGATEVCVQAGLAPSIDGSDSTRAIARMRRPRNSRSSSQGAKSARNRPTPSRRARRRSSARRSRSAAR